MFKKLKPLKDLLWAAGIGIALMFLLIGFIAVNFTSYHGDRTRPVMDLRSGRESGQKRSELEAPAEDDGVGIHADGTLHSLAETKKAGQSYLDGLTILCDSSFSALRGAGLCEASVWSSDTGLLPMDSVSTWKIRYPVDDSMVSPSNAMLVAKPAILIVAVGGDASADLNKNSFVTNYTSLIQNLVKANPEAKIVCLSLCSVTSSYAGSNGMSAEQAQKINSWIQESCIQTGAYYGSLNETLCSNGYLLEAYADGSGCALNAAGLEALLEYLQSHDVTKQ